MAPWVDLRHGDEGKGRHGEGDREMPLVRIIASYTFNGNELPFRSSGFHSRSLFCRSWKPLLQRTKSADCAMYSRYYLDTDISQSHISSTLRVPASPLLSVGCVFQQRCPYPSKGESFRSGFDEDRLSTAWPRSRLPAAWFRRRGKGRF